MARDLLSINQACDTLGGCSRTTFAKIREAPDFPAPVIVGSRPMFFATEVKAWLEALPRATSPPTRKNEAQRA